jgi:hypothetical protein
MAIEHHNRIGCNFVTNRATRASTSDWHFHT